MAVDIRGHQQALFNKTHPKPTILESSNRTWDLTIVTLTTNYQHPSSRNLPSYAPRRWPTSFRSYTTLARPQLLHNYVRYAAPLRTPCWAYYCQHNCTRSFKVIQSQSNVWEELIFPRSNNHSRCQSESGIGSSRKQWRWVNQRNRSEFSKWCSTWYSCHH